MQLSPPGKRWQSPTSSAMSSAGGDLAGEGDGSRQQKQAGGIVRSATISSFLLIGFLAAGIPAAQVFGAEAERKPQGKPPPKPDFVLTIKDNLVSLTATNASLKKILEEIGQRMSIEVFAFLPEQEKITTEFEQLPLEEMIERLIRNYPHLVVSEESDRRITRILSCERLKIRSHRNR